MFLLALFVGCQIDTDRAGQSLTILHSSEHHGVALPLEDSEKELVGGMARRATLIDQITREASAVLLVDSGDILIGTAFSSWFRGEPDVKAMSLMGYQAMAAGNHDFDYGLKHLRDLQDLASFPILCSNLIGQDVELPCQRSVILQIGDLAVGVLGVVGHSNFPDTFNREVVKALNLLDPIEAVREQARQWKKEKKVDLLVVVTHQETDEDRRLLTQVEEIDVVVGGHTIGFDGLLVPGAGTPVEEVEGPVRVFVKTHRQGRTLGRLDLEIERGVIIRARARNIPVTETVALYGEVQQLLATYQQRFSSQAYQVVGRSLVKLVGEQEFVRSQETNLGNLLADLMRTHYDQEVAVINSGQIRATIPAGPVNLSRVLSVLPFDSSMVTLKVTGQQIRSALENSVSLLPGHAGRFLQVSGLRVTYDLTAPKGARVQKVMVGDHILNPDRTYSMVTDTFLADGGDGYTMFQQAIHRLDHQTPVRDLLLQALARAPLTAEKDGRIRFVHSPGVPSQDSGP